MKVNTGLSDKNREDIVKILNVALADEFVLSTKTRNYHWNVEGSRFNDLHKFFEAQYNEIAEKIDDIAERARALGGNSVATLTEYLKITRLKETPGRYPDSDKMLQDLLEDHETFIRALRKDVDAVEERGDAGTTDFLTGIMEEHEKMAWMLRSFLNK